MADSIRSEEVGDTVVGENDAPGVIRSEIDRDCVADPQDQSIATSCQLNNVRLVSSMCRSDEVFGTALNPLDRAAE